MGLVYDACKGQPERDRDHDCEDHVKVDESVIADQSNSIRDLFGEMEEICQAQDGADAHEARAQTLFGEGVMGVLTSPAMRALAAIGYAVILVGTFAGAFALAVWAFSVDSIAGGYHVNPTAATIALAPMKSELPVKDEDFQHIDLPRSPFAAAETTAAIEPAAKHRQAVANAPAPKAVITLAGGDRITLNGIVRWTGEKPIAVINGATVSPGDIVGGYTVVAIEERGVMLLAKGQMYYLELDEEISPA